MKPKVRKILERRKRKLERRHNRKSRRADRGPVFSGRPVYEMAEREQAIGEGGIGLVHGFAKKLGLVRLIDERLYLLKFHFPYYESDHVLNIAYNAMCGGTCLDDIELHRNDEGFLDALGAERIPDPTTAGDFCRRFEKEDVIELQNIFDKVRLEVWSRQPDSFFEEAVVDMDGTMVTTHGQCKEGMDISYKGTWGYHPLLVSLANTGEPLRVINRPGNEPSHEGAWASVNDVIELCREAGFRRISLRGDTDFSQTAYLDEWSAAGDVRFVYGIDAMPNLVDLAEELASDTWKLLKRRDKRPRKGEPRTRPENVKQKIVELRGFRDLRLVSEDIAEFDYRPCKCKRSYRMVVLRKNIEERIGGVPLIDGLHTRFFFYITNDTESPVEEIVFRANDRCNQENLIEQLKNGVPALHAPVDNLVSNWAYMEMTALAWSLKAWMALCLPEKPGRWLERRKEEKQLVLKMEFKAFVNNFIRIPAKIVRTGRQLVYRILSWNRHLPTFFRMADVLRC